MPLIEQNPDPIIQEKSNPKWKPFLIIGVGLIVVGVVVSVGWGIYAARHATSEPISQTATSSASSLEEKQSTTSSTTLINTKIQPSSNISQICSESKKSSDGNYAPEEVVLQFKSGFTSTEITKYLNDRGYQISNSYLIQEPTGVVVKWTDKFMQENKISIQEVNDFLNEIKKESYIKSVEVSPFWHIWPMTASNENQVQRIDRWGYFIVTLTDMNKKDEFLKKYPEVTFFGNGKIQGEYLMENPSVAEIIILYKAQKALEILNAIKVGAKLQDGVIEENRTNWGASMQRLAVFVDEYSTRDVTDTTYVTNFGINFSSSYAGASISQFLLKYSEIDTKKTIPNMRLDFLTIKVPIGEEECWAKELTKEPVIESATLNYYVSFDI